MHETVLTLTDEEMTERAMLVEAIDAECRAYSAAAREGVAERWWKIDPPDYACGGVDVEEDSIPTVAWRMALDTSLFASFPSFQMPSTEDMTEWRAAVVDDVLRRTEWVRARDEGIKLLGVTLEPAGCLDLMAAIRDIARGR